VVKVAALMAVILVDLLKLTQAAVAVALESIVITIPVVMGEVVK
jgi:hypothetical protein